MPPRPLSPESLLERVGSPMLAVLQTRLDGLGPGEWVFELKYDGFRALGALAGGQPLLVSRNGNDFAQRFPEIAAALPTLRAEEAVVDGEIIVRDEHGRDRFSMISSEGKRHLVLFDLLWLEGRDVRALPLEERRALLRKILPRSSRRISLSERLEGPAQVALNEAAARGAEGVIAKRPQSVYASIRSPDWQKLKVRAGQELAIVGYTPTSTGAPGIGALFLGVAEKNRFLFAGKVGTGFDIAMRRKLETWLSRDVVAAPLVDGAPRERGARWVTPRLVAQVAFTEWTPDGRLRHPSFQGLRDDKRPEECRRESASRLLGRGTKVTRNLSAAQARSARVSPRKGARRVSRRKTPPTTKVTLTHPDRVVYRSTRSTRSAQSAPLTKADVFQYYADVSEAMLPVLRDRPLTLEQFPQGADKPGFIRQNIIGAPPWMKTVRVQHEGRVVNHATASDLDSLLWLANQNALTLHGWSSREPKLTSPDWVVFDLDPGEGTFDALIELTLALRGLLEQLQLESFPKTSGKRGLHVFLPVQGATHEDATAFAVAVMGALARGLPHLGTTERSKSKRNGKLYLDAFQNGFGKTVCLPYSLRALPHAPASAPLKWSEVTRRLDPKAFTLKTLPKRLDKVGDLFADVLKTRQRLPKLTRG